MSENNAPDRVPNRLPAEKAADVQARAQRILDLRGRPPYTQEHFTGEGKAITDDEIKIIWEFVYYWMPLLVEKEKPR